MPSAPIALFGDLGFQELLLVAVVSVMIFGKRLPEVAGQAFAQFQKLRRTLTQMWRETGIDEELRRIQRDLDRKTQRDRQLPAPPRRPPSSTVPREKIPQEQIPKEKVESPGSSVPETFARPDDGPAGESERSRVEGSPPAPPTEPVAETEPSSEEQPAPDATAGAARSSQEEARREP